MNKNKPHRVVENFREFMMSADIHQRPDVSDRYQASNNPSDDQMDLPYEFERRPEVGEGLDEIQLTFEKLQALSDAGINKYNSLKQNGVPISPYINRQLELAYKHFREAYLRMMDTK